MKSKQNLGFMYEGFKSQVIPDIAEDPPLMRKVSTDLLERCLSKLDWRNVQVRHLWYRNIWYKISYFPKEIKWFIQRGQRGYSDRDLWDYDVYLATIIRDGLRDLSYKVYGHPTDYKNIKQWQKRLNSTADAFDVWLNYFNMDDVEPDSEKTKTKTYWKNREKRVKTNEKKLHTFIDDFGKYWD